MYVNSMQVDDIKICPRKNPHTVILNSRYSLGMPSLTSGKVVLQRRLENIIAFKVDLFYMNGLAPANPLADGFAALLKSAYLGSLVVDNLFQTGTSLDATQTVVNQNTDVIAWLFPSPFGNVNSIVDPYLCNNLKKFSRPRDIDTFDWKVELVSGLAIVGVAPYAVEIVITFYEACHCNY